LSPKVKKQRKQKEMFPEAADLLILTVAENEHFDEDLLEFDD